MTGNSSTNYNSNDSNGNAMVRAIRNKRIRDVDMMLQRFSKRDLHKPVYASGISAPYATIAALYGYRTLVQKIMQKMDHERGHHMYPTPLFIAVDNGDMKMIEALNWIPQSNPKVTVESYHLTIMHAVPYLASRMPRNKRNTVTMIVRKLVSMGVPVDKKAWDSNETTPLQLLVQLKCDPEIMHGVAKILLDNGAKANAKLKQLDLHTPLKRAANAHAEENFGYIHILVKAFQYHRMTSTASMQLLLDDLIDLFKSRGANINAKTSDGNTPLMFAAREGNNAMIRILLKHGASTSIKNKDGKKASDLYAASARRSNSIPNTNISNLLGPLSKKTYNKSIRLQTNMNISDPISLNNVTMNNAYAITKDMRTVNMKNNQGRNERVTLIQRVYNKSSMDGLLASGRSLVSPITLWD